MVITICGQWVLISHLQGLTLILNGFNTSKVMVEDVDHIGLGKFVRYVKKCRLMEAIPHYFSKLYFLHLHDCDWGTDVFMRHKG